MTSGSDSILAVSQSFGSDSQIKSLKENINNITSPGSPDIENGNNNNNIVWKDLGQYLENLTEIPPSEQSYLKNNLNLKNPLNNIINYRVCTLCDRPILVDHLPKHIKTCLEMKQRKEDQQKQQQHAPQKSSTSNANAEPSANTKANNKKRKLTADSNLDTESSTPKPKKTKKEKEATAAKPKKKSTARQKGPVDVERQCGVALPTGGFCARSLTCKTHSMGAKRAVPGRSASYDTLLAAYQHKNQVKIAGQAAKAQAEKDELIHGGPTALDSDEETQQVLSGVSRSFPLPLERKNLVPTRIRSNFLKMREMFAGAILPRITNSNGVGGINGRTALLDVDRSNEHLFLVRAPQRIMLNKNNIQQQQQAQAQAAQQAQGKTQQPSISNTNQQSPLQQQQQVQQQTSQIQQTQQSQQTQQQQQTQQAHAAALARAQQFNQMATNPTQYEASIARMRQLNAQRKSAQENGF